MPGFLWNAFNDPASQSKVFAKRAERVIGKAGPSRAGKQQSIDPWSETVAGKSTQKTFLRALAMGHHRSPPETAFEFRPQRK
jgi:hypothetical protein